MAKDNPVNNEVNNESIDLIIKDLVQLGKATTEVKMFDHTWKFKTLNSTEHMDSVSASSDRNDRYSRLFRVQTTTLEAALVSIDGKVLTMDEKRFLFGNVNTVVVEELYLAYTDFRRDQASKLRSIGGQEPLTEGEPALAPEDAAMLGMTSGI